MSKEISSFEQNARYILGKHFPEVEFAGECNFEKLTNLMDISQGFDIPPRKHVESKEVKPLQIEGTTE